MDSGREGYFSEGYKGKSGEPAFAKKASRAFLELARFFTLPSHFPLG